MAEVGGALSSLFLRGITEIVDLRFAEVVGATSLARTVFFGGGVWGVEFVGVVGQVYGVGEVLQSLGDGGGSNLDGYYGFRLISERFDKTEALHVRMADFDGLWVGTRRGGWLPERGVQGLAEAVER